MQQILIFAIFSLLTLGGRAVGEETHQQTKEDVKVLLVDEDDKVIQSQSDDEEREIYVKDKYEPSEEEYVLEEDATKKIDVDIKINGDIGGLYNHNAKKYKVKVRVNKEEPRYYEEEDKKEGILVRLVKGAIRYTGF